MFYKLFLKWRMKNSLKLKYSLEANLNLDYSCSLRNDSSWDFVYIELARVKCLESIINTTP